MNGNRDSLTEEWIAERPKLKRRNEELDEFAEIVAHDLKEPLRGIRHDVDFVLQIEPRTRLYVLLHLGPGRSRDARWRMISRAHGHRIAELRRVASENGTRDGSGTASLVCWSSRHLAGVSRRTVARSWEDGWWSMIDRGRIQNFKCLLDTTVDLVPLTMLIGPNDSGKTSFLDAIRLLGGTTERALSEVFQADNRGSRSNSLQSLVWRRERHLSIGWRVQGRANQFFEYELCLPVNGQMPRTDATQCEY